jgi:hypothetical protein
MSCPHKQNRTWETIPKGSDSDVSSDTWYCQLSRLCLSSDVLNQNITFRELDLLPSSGKALVPLTSPVDLSELEEQRIPKKIIYRVLLKVSSFSCINYVLLVQ